MTIGLLSDTHGYLDNKVFSHFDRCDEIWHAGDIGSTDVCDALEKFKPLRAVYGNVDDRQIQNRYPETLRFTCEGVSVFMTHIAGTPPKYNRRVKALLDQAVPDIFVCGHSHVLGIKRDPIHNNMLFINPGAAGNHGFHHVKTLVRFTLTHGSIHNMEVIEIGRRGAVESTPD